jgi:hypothetical protein
MQTRPRSAASRVYSWRLPEWSEATRQFGALKGIEVESLATPEDEDRPL